MSLLGFGPTQIRYDMFDLERSAEVAKRMQRCAGLYHRGQEDAWDGREVLSMLLAKHGGVRICDEAQHALRQIFSIILWGELAAWKISAQLADRLVPLEAKMAATSQAFDEARHFYVMYDYLRELGYTPQRMGPAPQALVDMVLEADDLAHKVLGMQLMIETIALGVFQNIRESGVEPVLCELMKYYERDEARHVGLGVQYLPLLVGQKSRFGMARLTWFQLRLLFWGLAEAKFLEREFTALGIDTRRMIDQVLRKQFAATREVYAVLGIDMTDGGQWISRGLKGLIQGGFPRPGEARDLVSRLEAAWHASRADLEVHHVEEEFAVHAQHRIQLAQGGLSDPEPDLPEGGGAAAS